VEGGVDSDQLYATKTDAGSYFEYNYYWSPSNEKLSNYTDYITINARVTMPGEVTETNGQRLDKKTVYFKDVQKMSEAAYVKSRVQKGVCAPALILSLLLTIFVFYRKA